MLRFDRVGMVAAVVGVVAVGLATGANARDATRDFPVGWCPVHSGGPIAVPASPGDGDPFLFKAKKATALLTFVTCDGRSVAGSPYSVDLALDDLVVVDLAVYNAYRIPYDKAVSEKHWYTEKCYTRNTDEQTFKVKDVFARDLCFSKRAVPFTENFEAGGRHWYFGNSCVATEATGTDPCTSATPPTPGERSLILSRSARSDGRQCSVASVKVDGLVPGRHYVVDFAWSAQGLDSSLVPQPILSFFVDTVPASW